MDGVLMGPRTGMPACATSWPRFGFRDEILAPILDILGNKQAIAINQAWAGHPGTLVRSLPPAGPPSPPVGPGNAVVGVPCSSKDATTTKWEYDTEAKRVKKDGLCLTTTSWGSPAFLAACDAGNATHFQNFTYNANAKTFDTACPANHPTPTYPAALTISHEPGSIQKVYAYRPAKLNAGQMWDYDAAAGTITATGAGSCLAGRTPSTPPPPGVAGVQFWSKPLGEGKTAVLFINGGSLSYPTASISLAELNITASADAAVTVADVWTGDDAGPVVGGNWSTGLVPPLDSKFVVITSA